MNDSFASEHAVSVQRYERLKRAFRNDWDFEECLNMIESMYDARERGDTQQFDGLWSQFVWRFIGRIARYNPPNISKR